MPCVGAFGTGCGSASEAFVWVFGFSYCVLVWQWMAEMHAWPRFLLGKQLWAASSIYFLVVDGFLIRQVIKQGTIDNVELGSILIPIVFLTLTLPLWRMKTKDEP